MREDLRVVKTKQAVENAFVSLIEEKGFENVKIIDIANRANVNRNTIYLHYDSKEGIIEKIIDESFTKSISNFDIPSYLAPRFNRKKIHDMYTTMFDLINEHIELYRIILTDQNLSGYLTRKLKQIKSYFMDVLRPTFKNDAIIEFVLSGIFGIFRNWIIYDKGTIEENVAIIVDLSLANIRHVQFK